MYKPIPAIWCCDNCQPARFTVENVYNMDAPGLRCGKKKKISKAEEAAVRAFLNEWRDVLYHEFYSSGGGGLSLATLMSNKVIEQIMTCGEQPRSLTELARHTQWALILDHNTSQLNSWGEKFMAALNNFYDQLELREAREQVAQAYIDWMKEIIGAEEFYRANTLKDFTNLTPSTYNSDAEEDCHNMITIKDFIILTSKEYD
ncbi:hypothetical protein CVT24_012972 [Panaeolus cyanescens]|uniref:Uncharacterized protein n=1 Tax=Panaeolus cyanescens TaxID=181874 RepID=A0A409YUN3_9AGAR|nr:hypothetical protein CVT24_012972 [Panaeolus cyanescens]